MDACDHSQVKEKIEHEVKDEAKKAEEAAPKPINSPYQSMFYESHSSYNGKNYVEEHRERVQDSDGNLHVTTRRRLGDRWYESKSITDGEGKTSTKETWHNVPEDQIDQFKQEWADQHQAKYTPIEHDTKEEAEKTQENAIKKD
ncbi:cysteine protease [Tritrichomonas foetus]|uniref:Cysteine protease n=1 Tax=Tritrichomonas foetus TaxID=1144522 RepID=A0A1J4KAK0_9EUKA|nr:cysteine protease [Tritrichomonas foetus]OHT06716.1 cysteine protease [Tritrichomonas foetus]|eukprot:OHT06716.1 cysteine protease [Tritrichomonas foetus]